MMRHVGDLNVTGASAPPNYIQPGGFQLENVTLNNKTSVQLTTGGVISSTKLDDGTNTVVDVPDGLQAEADSEDSLLKGTWGPSSWFYMGIMSHSRGLNSPKLVYVQEGNSITDTDLDSGYDSFVALSIPGAISGWVLTDGNGDLFSGEWTTNGWFLPSQNMRDDTVLNTTNPATTPTAIDCSRHIPPTEVEAVIGCFVNDGTRLVLHHNTDFTAGPPHGQFAILVPGSNAQGVGNISGIKNQTLYYSTDIEQDTIAVRNATKWRVE